jgi:hypothetical protein
MCSNWARRCKACLSHDDVAALEMMHDNTGLRSRLLVRRRVAAGVWDRHWEKLYRTNSRRFPSKMCRRRGGLCAATNRFVSSPAKRVRKKSELKEGLT